MSAGKGDTPRPLSISQKEYNFRWNLAFGKVPPMSDEAFKQRIEEIRRGEKPSSSACGRDPCSGSKAEAPKAPANAD